MNKTRFTYLILSLIWTATVHAQYTYDVVLLESQSNKPITNAELYHVNTEKSFIPNKNGIVSINNLAKDPQKLIIISYEYETIYRDINIFNADIRDTVYLEPLSEQLSEVVINAKKEEIFALRKLRRVEGTAIYASKKTEVVLLDLIQGNLASNNSRQIYAQIAGLNIYEGSDGGLQLAIGGRGLDPNRSSNFNTRQNGYDISADVLGYPESYYTPPAEALSEIQVIRGAASLQYGTQFGGLVNFKTRSPSKEGPFKIRSRQTLGSFNFFNSYNEVSGTAGSFKYFSYYNFKQGDGYRDNSNFNANNAFLHLQYDISQQTSIAAELTYFKYLAQQAGGLTDAQFLQDPRQSNRKRNWFEVDWKLYSVNLNHNFSDRNKISVNLFALDARRSTIGFRGNPINLNENPVTALDEQNPDESFVNPRDVIEGEFNNWGMEIRSLNRYQLSGKENIFLFGIKYYKSANSSIQGPGSAGTDADFSILESTYPDYANQSSFQFPNQNISLFAEHIFNFSDKFSVTPGFRIESIKTVSDGTYRQVIFDNAGNPINNTQLSDDRNLVRHFPLLGIGASYLPSPTTELYANISQNYRSVTFSDIRVNSPTFIIDPDISDEKGFTSDIGLRGRMQQYLSYDIGVYGLFYNDRIGIILDDRANRVRKNIGSAVVLGFESVIDCNLAKIVLPESKQFKWNWFANTALTYSKYTGSEESNVVGKRVEFVPSINVKTGINLGYQNILMSAQLTYLSEQFTDVQNSATPQEGDNRAGVIGAIPAYQIMDFSLSWKKGVYTVESGINNLIGRDYYTRRATGYPGPGIIPSEGRSLFLTLGISL